MTLTGFTSSRVGLGLVAAVYLLAFPYHPKLRSPNELCRLYQSRALVDSRKLSINEVMQQRGGVGDLSCTRTVRDASGEYLRPCVGPNAARENVVAQHYYPSKAPLLSFAAAPVYAVLKAIHKDVSELRQVFWSRLFITVLPALAMLLLLRRFLAAYVEEATASLFTIIYALGTIAFTNAELFMSHQLTAVLLFAAFYSAWKVERGEWRLRGYALAGLAAGAAVVCEYTSVLGVLCVAAYTVAARWKRWPELARAAGLVVLGSLFPLLLLCWYHYAAFGSPLASGYKFLNDAGYMHWHEGGFLGIRLPYAQGFLHSFFSAQRGFFVLSPVFFCAFFGLRDLKQKDKALWVLLVALLVSHTYFTSAFDHTSWGWTPGPRHLTGMLPFLFLPIALLFERLREKPVPLAVVGGLSLSSLLCAQLVGHVAYVPPEVSTTVFGLALPLYSGGTLPVSWLAAYVPNPYPGVLLLLLGAAVLVWAALHFRRVRAPLAVMFLAAAAHLGILKLVPHGGKGEDGAVAFMRSVWLAPNDVRVDFSGK